MFRDHFPEPPVISTVLALDPGEQVPGCGSCTSGSIRALKCLPWGFLCSPPKARSEQGWQCSHRCPEPGTRPSVPCEALSIWFRGSTRCSNRPQVLSLWIVLGSPGPDPRAMVAASWVGSLPFVKAVYLPEDHMWLSCQNDADIWFCWHKWFLGTRTHKSYLLRALRILSFISNENCCE